MEFKIGDLVYVKTTGELGQVRGLPESKVRVLLPMVNKDTLSSRSTIVYDRTIDFCPYEIETFAERVSREIANLLLEKKAGTEAQEQFNEWLSQRQKLSVATELDDLVVQ